MLQLVSLVACSSWRGSPPWQVAYTVEKAQEQRDALCKAVYGNLFQKIIDEINSSLAKSQTRAVGARPLHTHTAGLMGVLPLLFGSDARPLRADALVDQIPVVSLLLVGFFESLKNTSLATTPRNPRTTRTSSACSTSSGSSRSRGTASSSSASTSATRSCSSTSMSTSSASSKRSVTCAQNRRTTSTFEPPTRTSSRRRMITLKASFAEHHSLTSEARLPSTAHVFAGRCTRPRA